MALNMAPETQAVFYEKVFGPTHVVTTTVKTLIQSGAKFDESFYGLSATIGGKSFTVELTKGVNSILKGTVDGAELVMNKDIISKWVTGLTMAAPDIKITLPKGLQGLFSVELQAIKPGMLLPAVKAVSDVTGFLPTTAKKLVDAVKVGEISYVVKDVPYSQAIAAFTKLSQVGEAKLIPKKSSDLNKAEKSPADASGFADALKNTVPAPSPDDNYGFAPASAPASTEPKTPVIPKVLNTVIKLKDAKAVGQKVRGTSLTSVYRAIAIGERVSLAARITSQGAISIRAEWPTPLTDAEKLQLTGIGMELKDDGKGELYASIHFDAAGVAPGRIIGAFVVGAGFKWTEAVTSAADLVVG